MKIANSILICVLLLFAVQNGIASESAHHETNETVKDETNLMEQPVSFAVLPNAGDEHIIKSNEFQAWQQFCIAKNSEMAVVRSEAYANAIKHISEACVMDPERPASLLLASRIYRSMGGLSYAKNYFSKAAALYLNEAIQNSESIRANLNAAIILYAGDVRYWDSYEESKKHSWGYADRVLELCKKKRAKKITEVNEEIFLEEATALALMIKENIAGSNAHFTKAEKLWNKETVKPVSELIKMVEFEEQNDLEEDDLYKPYALFKKYPQQGKWFWLVTKQTEASKEFLLNCLTGFY